MYPGITEWNDGAEVWYPLDSLGGSRPGREAGEYLCVLSAGGWVMEPGEACHFMV